MKGGGGWEGDGGLRLSRMYSSLSKGTVLKTVNDKGYEQNGEH